MTAPASPVHPTWLQEDWLTSGLMTRRVFAWVMDAFLIGLIAMALWFVLAAFTVLTLGFGAPMFALMAMLPWVYGFVSLLSPLQASPGQAMMGLMVVRDQDLGLPTPLQAFLFMMGYCLTMAFGAIWTAVALVTTRHRTLHDIVSGLVVVRRAAMQQRLTGLDMRWNMGPPGPGGGHTP